MINRKAIESRIDERYQGNKAAFCRDVDISRPFLYLVLNGERNPSIDTLAQWAKVLGLTLNDLWIQEKSGARPARDRAPLVTVGCIVP